MSKVSLTANTVSPLAGTPATASVDTLAVGNDIIITDKSMRVGNVIMGDYYFEVGSNVKIDRTGIHVGNSFIGVESNVAALYFGSDGTRQLVNGSFGGTGRYDYQEFTANGTWTKPVATGYDADSPVIAILWGGGGGGNTTTGWGGGGGACVVLELTAGQLGTTETVTVRGAAAAGAVGGNTHFGNFIAYGGAGANTTRSGSGGGTMSAGTLAAAGSPVGGAIANPGGDSLFGGGGGTTTAAAAGGSSVYGGGGGSATTGVGGRSVYGGGGGAGTTGVAGTSMMGGKGANSSTAAAAPGGGGAGSTNTTGARGEVRVWTYKSWMTS